ncbi:hypothetical protein BJ508DRAFT_365308 [Ascobolus immersus RN42]|uniref:Uncharacterized protein n=1 Tax=Ascobolus immersus RN42 TaxID=1160509 RepID=A0A3N4HVK3_ASCIM|nr:hypothetical protein BJ508DRAFT_365308 [Ascobolus immersus RN42]
MEDPSEANEHTLQCFKELYETVEKNTSIKRLAPVSQAFLNRTIEESAVSIKTIASQEFENIEMLRLMSSLMDEQKKNPTRFPSISFNTIKSELRDVLSSLASKHGFSCLDYAQFYCGLLIVVHILTGERIALDKQLCHDTSDARLRQTSVRGHERVTLPFKGIWLPVRMPVQTTVRDHEMFLQAQKVAADFTRRSGSACGITQMGFGFEGLNSAVLLVYTGQNVLIQQEDFGQPTLICHQDLDSLLSIPTSTASATSTRPDSRSSNNPPSTATTTLEKMERIICEDFCRKTNNHSTLGEYLAALKPKTQTSLAADSCRNTIRLHGKLPILYHGASISLQDQVSRGSFGVFLNAKINGSSDKLPSALARLFITAGHVAPMNGGTLQSTSGMDMIRSAIIRMRSNGTFLAFDESMAQKAFDEVNLIGEVMEYQIGITEDNERLDYALCQTELTEEDGKNGFHIAASDSEGLLEWFPSRALGPVRGSLLDEFGEDLEEMMHEAISKVAGAEDPVRDSMERVFKQGAATGVTGGITNGVRFLCFKRASTHVASEGFDENGNQIEHSHSAFESVECAKFDVVCPPPQALGDQDPNIFCKEGDSGSGVFKLVRTPTGYKLLWKGLLVQMINENHNIGLVIPASVLLNHLSKKHNAKFTVSH